MTDEKIIQLYFNRNEKAIEETAIKYSSYCYKIANNILRNRQDSEECLNDTWMQTWDSIPPTHPVHFNLFLAKIVRRRCTIVTIPFRIPFLCNCRIPTGNKYRNNYTQKRGRGEIALVLEELEECLAGHSDVEALYIAEELQETINTFVRALPEREGNVFIRRYFYSDSIKDISVRYRMSENNIRVMLNRTRNKLRDRLEKEGYLS